MSQVRGIGAVVFCVVASWSASVPAQVQTAVEGPVPDVKVAPVLDSDDSAAPASAAATDNEIPATGVVAPKPANPPATAKPEPQFDLLEIDVAGNTLLKSVVMQTALEPFLGPGKTPHDVEAARDSLEQLYHELGYKTVTVAIPEQTLRDGVVNLQVSEGPIHQVTISGDQYTSQKVLREELPALASGQTPNFEDLKRQLAYANRLPTRKVTPSLRAGSAPGTVDIELNVEDQPPLHGSLEFNNKRSNLTTANRAVVGLGYDNLFQLGHSINLSFQIAPQRPADGRVYYGSYLAPFGDGSWNLMFSALKNDSDIAAFTGLDVIGKGETYGIKLIKQLADIGGVIYPSLSLGIDDKNLSTVTDKNVPAHYYPITLAYSQTVRLESQSLQDDLSLVLPLPNSGSDQLTLDDSRFGARRQWFYLRSSNTYSLNFLSYCQAEIKVGGQLTDQPLINSEQFIVGGVDTVRGYFESEAVGDLGVNGSLELRGPSAPDFFAASVWAQRLTELRPFAFVDAASVSLHGPFPDSQTRRSSQLLSAGGGITLRLYNNFNGTVDFAVPLQDGPNTKHGDSRLLFRAVGSF